MADESGEGEESPHQGSAGGFGLANLREFFVQLIKTERVFLLLLLLGFLVSALTYDIPFVAMWVGFAVAGYSAVANDSIQTIGTFIASNRQQKWWVLWIFIGGIWLATVGYSWFNYDGDVTYQRLAHKGFEDSPTEFSFLQVAAPLFLLVLTRMRMPVSTTFLLLSSFAAGAGSIAKVAVKSLAGYGVAFTVAIVVWLALSKAMDRWFTGEPHRAWRPFQWVTSGLLWSVWIQQDAANIAVYLPRSMALWQFAAFAGVVFFGLGLLFKMGGERVQEIVDEKSGVVDVRAATVIDLVYAVILYVFKIYSNVPMSTTWVFIGLLGGREIAMAYRRSSDLSVKEAGKLLGKDIVFAGIGLTVSLALAYAVNEDFRNQVWNAVT
ncbi:MAG TPA: hypothetical protein RMH99_19175 [Sandaracinaceae bacterium LLY-WYZ-13_1]|nr:hypothetical protein [Sandaracinaceae bacterium LLY-WYZ-13_1]